MADQTPQPKRPKAAHGEGSLRWNEKKQRWILAISAPGGRRIYRYFTTQAEGLREKKRLLREIEEGIKPEYDRMTVAAYLRLWLDDVKAPKVSRKSLSLYRTIVERHLVPRLGKLRLRAVDPIVAQRHINAIAAEVSPARARECRGLLSRALGHAAAAGAIRLNPIPYTEAPAHVQQQPPAISPDVARQLLDAFRTERWGRLYALALLTGLRLGELRGLAWSAIDFEHGTLTVQQQAITIPAAEGSFQLTPTLKTRSSRRVVALSRTAVTVLRLQQAAQHEQRRIAGTRWTDLGLVFTKPNGRPPTSQTLEYRLKALTRAAGLPELTPHALRHGWGRLQLDAGTPLKIVADGMGHATIKETADRYTRTDVGHQAGAAAALDRLLADDDGATRDTG